MLAALNHPNICAIYGFEEADGVRFLILELVEGETLARHAGAACDRARTGTGLPLDARVGDRAADRRGARSRARQRHRPPRSEASEHQDHAGRRREGSRLRPRQGRRWRWVVAGPDAAPPARRRDAQRRRHRHRRLHEPRAGARTAGRQAHRHLGVRLRALRDVDRARRRLPATRSPTRLPRFSSASRTGRRCRPTTPASIRRLLLRCLTKDPKSGCETSATSGSRSTRSTRSCQAGLRRRSHTSCVQEATRGCLGSRSHACRRRALAWQARRAPIDQERAAFGRFLAFHRLGRLRRFRRDLTRR